MQQSVQPVAYHVHMGHRSMSDGKFCVSVLVDYIRIFNDCMQRSTLDTVSEECIA